MAGNLCRILEREIEQGPAGEERERELLAGLLAEPIDGRSAAELNAAVAERLIGDPDADFERSAWRAIVEIVRGKLAIVKPAHDSYDFAGEQKE